MRKKSLAQLSLGWLMLLSLLLHVLLTHQACAAEPLPLQEAGRLVIESGLFHVRMHQGQHAHHRHYARPEHEDEPAGETPAHSHRFVDHPEAYLCPSSLEAQDLLALRLASQLSAIPLLGLQLPQPPLKPARRWDVLAPQPPPEQRRRALSTTILLI